MSEYEFTDSQNAIFAKLSVSLRRFGIQLGVFATLLIFFGLAFAIRGRYEGADAYTSVAGGVGIIFVGALTLALCFKLLKPVEEFRLIVNTEKNDIDWLITGLDKLAWAHRTLRLILVMLLLSAALLAYRVLT